MNYKIKGDQAHFQAPLSGQEGMIYYLHIPVPLEVAEHYKAKSIKRFICTLNNELEQHSSILSAGEDRYYIIMNQKNCKKLKLTEGDSVDVELLPDTSEYGMPMPEELMESLEIEDGALDYFKELTPGKQRALIHQVNSAKRTETRIRRALGIAFHLKKVKGKIDFKELREDIKNVE